MTLTAELVVDARCRLGEGPCWDARIGGLLWVDIDRAEVHTLIAGAHRTRAFAQPITALAPRAAGGYVLALRDGFGVLDDLDGEPRLRHDLRDGRDAWRCNDGGCDPAGRFWAGSMSTDGTLDAGALYRCDVDGTVTTVLDGLTISNGLGWSPDGQIMYVTDTGRGTITGFDFDLASGTLRERGIVVQATDGGAPDGLAVDAHGRLWVAFWGGGAVRCFTPEGAVVEEVAVPARHVTSCCFGGPALDVLYITTAASDEDRAEPHAGGLFRCRPGVHGLMRAAYAG
jgi:sugar lactone lactonase YvrE